MLVDYVPTTTSLDSTKKCHRKITLFCKEYEIKIRPVKILGATEGWLAMPNYDQLQQNHGDGDDQSNNKDGWRDVGETS